MKNEQLDAYVNALGARLKGLAPQQREEEMQEVRQHLESLVSWHMQEGKPVDEAVGLAIRQFGRAESVGKGLDQARSGVRLKFMRRAILKAIGLWLGQAVLIFLFFMSMSDKPTDFAYLLKDKLVWALLLAAPTVSAFWSKRMLQKLASSRVS
jgi:hypothetical protein